MNLLEETRKKLEAHGKNVFDIVWFGTRKYHFIADIQTLFSLEYDEDFGAVEIPLDLVVVGTGWWLERHEYDGSEWWEYKEVPVCPKVVATTRSLFPHPGDETARLTDNKNVL
jgi:hypothetical protein